MPKSPVAAVPSPALAPKTPVSSAAIRLERMNSRQECPAIPPRTRSASGVLGNCGLPACSNCLHLVVIVYSPLRTRRWYRSETVLAKVRVQARFYANHSVTSRSTHSIQSHSRTRTRSIDSICLPCDCVECYNSPHVNLRVLDRLSLGKLSVCAARR